MSLEVDAEEKGEQGQGYLQVAVQLKHHEDRGEYWGS